MGLEHFQQACPAVSTLQDAQVWCVAKACVIRLLRSACRAAVGAGRS